MCHDAHVARYGNITKKLMDNLIEGARSGGQINTASAYDRIAFSADL